MGPRAEGWPRQHCQEPGTLGALLPSHRTEALFPVFFSKGVQTSLLKH